MQSKLTTTASHLIDGGRQTLAEALGVARGETVALVGGGGKTSAMLRLAAELAAHGGRVLVTTTTHIYPPHSPEFPIVIDNSLESLIRAVRTALLDSPIVVVASARNAEGKLVGIDPEWVDQLRQRIPFTNLLVEADGAAGRAFKAPAEHEPVIPPSSDLVIPVVGLSVIGRPLTAEFVHRAERVAALTGIALGAAVTPEAVAAVLLHPEGSVRGAPGSARIVSLLNQADDRTRLEIARLIAGELIAHGAERIVIAALADPPPDAVPGHSAPQTAGCVRAVVVRASNPSDITTTAGAGIDREASQPRAPVSAIVLAAGEGRRMGLLKPDVLKLALPLEGKTLLHRVVEAALLAPVDEVVVVLGHGAAKLARELPVDRRVRTVYNSRYAEGQSSSLKAGVGALAPETEAAVFLLADQPRIDPEAITAVVDAFRSHHAAVVRARYRGTPGHPVLFARALFSQLLETTGDQGGREVLARRQAEACMVDFDLEAPDDVDTMEDYAKLGGRLPGHETP